MTVSFVTLDVFTDRPFGGNPLAVIPDGRGLSTEKMQTTAREFNLSETTFVLPAEDPDATHKVRIFTPKAELDFAGHPTIGTAIALAEADKKDSADFAFEEGVGVVSVKVRPNGRGGLEAELSVAKLPEQMESTVAADKWAELLGLDTEDIYGATNPALWSCGAPFTYVPLTSLDALARASIEAGAWKTHLSADPSAGVFVFTNTAENTIQARMFAPAQGIAEDPATGSAVAALAGWLMAHDPRPDGKAHWTIDQGIEMGRPSHLELDVEIESGRISAVRVRGSAVVISRGTLNVLTDL